MDAKDPLHESTSSSSCFLPVAQSLARQLEQLKQRDSPRSISEPSDDQSERRYSDFSQTSISETDFKRRPRSTCNHQQYQYFQSQSQSQLQLHQQHQLQLQLQLQLQSEPEPEPEPEPEAGTKLELETRSTQLPSSLCANRTHNINSHSNRMVDVHTQSHSHTTRDEHISMSSLSLSSPPPVQLLQKDTCVHVQKSAQLKPNHVNADRTKSILCNTKNTEQISTTKDVGSYSSLRRLFNQKMAKGKSSSNSSKHQHQSTSRYQKNIQFYGIPVDTQPSPYHSPYFVADDALNRPKPIRPIVNDKNKKCNNHNKNRGLQAVWNFLSGRNRSRPRSTRRMSRHDQMSSSATDNQGRLVNRKSFDNDNANSISDNNNNNNSLFIEHSNNKSSTKNPHHIDNYNKRGDWVPESFRLLRRSSNHNSTENGERMARNSSSVGAPTLIGVPTGSPVTTPSPSSVSTSPSSQPSASSKAHTKLQSSNYSYRSRFSNTSCSSAAVDGFINSSFNNSNDDDNISNNKSKNNKSNENNNNIKSKAEAVNEDKLETSYGTLPNFDDVPRYATFGDAREPNTFGGFRNLLVVTADGSSISSCSDREDDAQHLYLSQKQLQAMQ